jgi:hypothetical protein
VLWLAALVTMSNFALLANRVSQAISPAIRLSSNLLTTVGTFSMFPMHEQGVEKNK